MTTHFVQQGFGRLVQAGTIGSVNVVSGGVFVGGREISNESKQGHCKVTVTLEYENGSIVQDVSRYTSAPPIFQMEVRGDASSVHAVAANVRVQGNVAGSVSSMSGNVHVTGNVQGSASSLSGNVQVAKPTQTTSRAASAKAHKKLYTGTKKRKTKVGRYPLCVSAVGIRHGGYASS
jgi:hypothetical protein